MIDKKNKIQQEEKAVLVAVIQKDQTETQVVEYLDELAFPGRDSRGHYGKAVYPETSASRQPAFCRQGKAGGNQELFKGQGYRRGHF